MMLLSFTTTAILSAVLIIVLISNSSRLGLIAVPNKRSAHKRITPCGAGIAFMSATFVGATFTSDWSIYSPYPLTIFSTLMIFALGVYDDYKHSSSNLKFVIIMLAAILLLVDGMEINTVGNYFGHETSLGFLAIPITLVAVVGFTNALNLVDGLDGLAATLTLIIIAGIGYIGSISNDYFIVTISTVLFSALAIFLVFNWNPARVFMGDSGSLTLGFIIAVLSIKATAYVDPVSILYITALPIIDTVTVMVRRKLNGQSMVSADKNHVHHIVLDSLNGNVRKTVFALGSVQLVFTLFGVFVAPYLGQEITLSLFLACIVGIYFVIESLCRRTNRCMFTS